MKRRTAIGGLLAAILGKPAFALAQDRMGEVIQDTDRYGNSKAVAPIAKSARQQNDAGIDGSGLCVVASLVAILRDQGEPEVARWVWEEALQDAGGYWPDKLDRLLERAKQAFPNKRFAWVHCRDSRWREFAKEWTGKGYTLGTVYARGSRYRGEIDHMVDLESYGVGDYVLFMDNNFVDGSVTGDTRGPRSWVPTPEADYRMTARGGPWLLAVLTERTPDRPDNPLVPPDLPRPSDRLAGPLALILGAAAAAGLIKRHQDG